MKNRKENFFINDVFRDDDNNHYNRDDVEDVDDDDEDDIMNRCLRIFPHITMQSRIITTCCSTVVVELTDCSSCPGRHPLVKATAPMETDALLYIGLRGSPEY